MLNSTYHLKAHRTSNSMVPKLPTQRKEKGYCDYKCVICRILGRGGGGGGLDF